MSEYGEIAAAGPSQPRRRRIHKQRFSRSRTGCLTCRGRRIRCDETHPTCERCVELELHCTWPPKVPAASKPGESSRQATPIRHASIADQLASSGSTPQDGTHMGWRPPETHVNGNRNGNVGEGDSLSAAWTAQNAAALSSLYEFANNDLGMPWDVNLEGFLAGPGNSGAIQPFYEPNQDSDRANGNAVMQSWASNGALPNGSYGQPGSLPTPGLSAFNAMPMSNTSLAPNLGDMPSHWPPNQYSSSLPSFPNPYTTPISLSIPKTINDPIEQVFPSADSKMIFQHVRSKTSTIITALGLKDAKPQNPFMDMALRTILIDTASPAQTAFRHSMLSLGAAHVYHQYRSSSPVQAQNMRVRTVKSKRKAMGFLGISICDETQKQAEQTDILLATCMTIHVRNTLCADSIWEDNLAFVLRHINRRGGPGTLLAEVSHGCDRRFLLEQIAVADLFSTFTTGHEPTLLGQSAGWWTDNTAQTGEYERYLGVSKGMTDNIAKYRIIHSRYIHLQSQGGPTDTMTNTLSDAIAQSARTILDRLNQWSMTLGQATNPHTKRIQNGDQVYSHMITISLLSEVLGVEPNSDRIQSPVRSILQLCSEMSQEPVNLLWPVLTAGARCLSEENRTWARQLLEVMRPHYCQDLEVAESLLTEQWTRIDCGGSFTDWSVLMKDMGKQVCLK